MARPRRWAAPAAALALALAATPVAPAQEAVADRSCVLTLEPTDSTRSVSRRVGEDTYVTHIRNGMRWLCDPATMTADSAVQYESRRTVVMIGSVHYRDTIRDLRSRRLTYYRTDDRVVAEDNVRLRQLETGSVLRGPRAEFYNAVRGAGPPRTVATRRPRMVIPPPGDRTGDPFRVVADTAILFGGQEAEARGNVVVRRDVLTARGGYARFRVQDGSGFLTRSPAVEGQDFRLTGDTIRVTFENSELRAVNAVGNAHLQGEEADVWAPVVDIRVADEKVEELWAHGGGPARAVSAEQEIHGDSLHFSFAGGRLAQLAAVGEALALEVRPADTTRAGRAAPPDTTPADEVAPADTTPPGQAAASDTTPAGEPAPPDTTPAVEPAPADTAPAARAAPADTTPAGEPAPADTTPAGEEAPADTVPAARDAPRDTIPAAEPAQADTAPAARAAPADTTPAGEAAPADTAPAAEAVPRDTTPAADVAPADTTPAREAAPADTTPAREPVPPDTTPAAEAAPPDTTPAARAAPADTTPGARPAPADTTPAPEAAPPDTTPAEEAAPPDTASAGDGNQIERLVAKGNARSFYLVPRQGTGEGAGGGEERLARNYVMGEQITIRFQSGTPLSVHGVRAIGLFLDPVEGAAPSDTTAGAAAAEDTAAVDTAAVDTSAVDTTVADAPSPDTAAADTAPGDSVSRDSISGAGAISPDTTPATETAPTDTTTAADDVPPDSMPAAEAAPPDTTPAGEAAPPDTTPNVGGPTRPGPDLRRNWIAGDTIRAVFAAARRAGAREPAAPDTVNGATTGDSVPRDTTAAAAAARDTAGAGAAAVDTSVADAPSPDTASRDTTTANTAAPGSTPGAEADTISSSSGRSRATGRPRRARRLPHLRHPGRRHTPAPARYYWERWHDL